jgi:hypothetical protein
MQKTINFNSDAIQLEIPWSQGVSESQQKIETAKQDLRGTLSIADTRKVKAELEELKQAPIVSQA